MAHVMVKCTLPRGLILEVVEPGVNGNPLPRGKTVMLPGSGSVTAVDKEFFEKWQARHKDSALFNTVSVQPEEKAK